MFDLVYKTLAPGGKLVLCKTVIKNEALAKESNIEGLDELIHLDLLKPLLEEAGFKNVIVDMSSSKMIYEVEADIPGEGKQTTEVQLGPEKFTDPELGFANVNDILARVTIMADK